MDAETLQWSIGLNVKAHLDLMHHFGQKLAARRRGGLLLVASTSALQGTPFSADYGAAKAYVLSLGEALHVEFQKVGVNVTVLLPGATDTPMLSDAGFSADDLPSFMKPMTTQRCVAEGLAALSANRVTHIAGRMNRIMAAVMPRSFATRLYGSLAERAVSGRNP